MDAVPRLKLVVKTRARIEERIALSNLDFSSDSKRKKQRSCIVRVRMMKQRSCIARVRMMR